MGETQHINSHICLRCPLRWKPDCVSPSQRWCLTFRPIILLSIIFIKKACFHPKVKVFENFVWLMFWWTEWFCSQVLVFQSVLLSGAQSSRNKLSSATTTTKQGQFFNLILLHRHLIWTKVQCHFEVSAYLRLDVPKYLSAMCTQPEATITAKNIHLDTNTSGKLSCLLAFNPPARTCWLPQKSRLKIKGWTWVCQYGTMCWHKLESLELPRFWISEIK